MNNEYFHFAFMQCKSVKGGGKEDCLQHPVTNGKA